MEWWVIQIDRQIFSSDINHKPAERFKLWIYLLSNVQRQDYKWLKRWQWFFKYDDIARYLNIKYNTVNKFMVWASSGKTVEPMLARQKTMRWVVVTILNYDKYQDYGKIKARQRQDKSKIKAKLYKEQYKQYKQNKEVDFWFDDEVNEIIIEYNKQRRNKLETLTEKWLNIFKKKLIKLWWWTNQWMRAILEQSIVNGWTWLFELKWANKNNYVPQTNEQRIREFEKAWTIKNFIAKYWKDKYREVKKLYQRSWEEEVLWHNNF